jgi:SnoaL-like protein
MDNERDLLARIERLEAIHEIRSLAVRYANAMDRRDMDAAVSLYVEDAPVSKGVRGREALKQNFNDVMGTYFTTSVHFIGNHLIEFDDSDPSRAGGHVYCRAEHEMIEGDNWVVVMLQYNDRYTRVDGKWYFWSRKMRPWYIVDVLDRPTGPDKIRFPMTDVFQSSTKAPIPEAWPTWHQFWEARDRTSGADRR